MVLVSLRDVVRGMGTQNPPPCHPLKVDCGGGGARRGKYSSGRDKGLRSVDIIGFCPAPSAVEINCLLSISSWADRSAVEINGFLIQRGRDKWFFKVFPLGLQKHVRNTLNGFLMVAMKKSTWGYGFGTLKRSPLSLPLLYYSFIKRAGR